MHFRFFICSSHIPQFLSGLVIRPSQKTTECYTNLWSFKMYFFNPLKWNKNFLNNLQCTMSEASTENGKFWGFSLLFLSLLSETYRSLHLGLKKPFALKTLLELQYFCGMILLRKSNHRHLVKSVPSYLPSWSHSQQYNL